MFFVHQALDRSDEGYGIGSSDVLWIVGFLQHMPGTMLLDQAFEQHRIEYETVDTRTHLHTAQTEGRHRVRKGLAMQRGTIACRLPGRQVIEISLLQSTVS